MSRRIEINRSESSEAEKISKLIDDFYVKNSKKDGEAYQTVSEADWKLAWALQRLAESHDKLTATVDVLAGVVNKLAGVVNKLAGMVDQASREGER